MVKQHYVYHKLQPQITWNIIYPKNMIFFRYVIVNNLYKD